MHSSVSGPVRQRLGETEASTDRGDRCDRSRPEVPGLQLGLQTAIRASLRLLRLEGRPTNGCRQATSSALLKALKTMQTHEKTAEKIDAGPQHPSVSLDPVASVAPSRRPRPTPNYGRPAALTGGGPLCQAGGPARSPTSGRCLDAGAGCHLCTSRQTAAQPSVPVASVTHPPPVLPQWRHERDPSVRDRGLRLFTSRRPSCPCSRTSTRPDPSSVRSLRSPSRSR